MIDTDGNLVALRKYEAKTDKKEKELEWLMAQTECFFNDIEQAVDSIRSIASGLDNDWDEEIDTELRQRLSL